MILRELVTRLGFELDDANLIKFEKSIKNAKENLKDLSQIANQAKYAIAGLVATSTGIAFLSHSVAVSTKETEKLANQLGVTNQELQGLELVAQSSGADVNELSKSFSSLNTNLTKSDGKSTDFTKSLINLGITTKGVNGKIKDSFALYGEIAKKITSLNNPIKQVALSQKLLGTNNLELVKTFSQSGEALKDQINSVGKLGYILDDKEVQASKDFIKSWNTLKIIIDGVRKELAVKFMPVFDKLVTRFKEWFTQNRQLISQNITGFVEGLATSLNILFKVVGALTVPLKFILSLFKDAEMLVIALSGALGALLIPRILALTTALLANPLTWWLTLLAGVGAAIALIIEDINAWREGHLSLIGTLLKDWFGFEGTFKDIMDNISNYFKNTINSMIEWFEEKFPSLAKRIGSLTSSINTQWQKGEAMTSSQSYLRNIGNIIKEEFDPIEFLKNAPEMIEGINPNYEPYDAPEIIYINPESSLNGIVPSTTSNSNSSSYNNINNNITENITINVPEGTTQEQSKAISDQVSALVQDQFDYNITRALNSLTTG